MYADVYFILLRNLLQAFLEILHMLYEERTAEGKVLLYLFVIVYYVDLDFILKVHLFDKGLGRLRVASFVLGFI